MPPKSIVPKFRPIHLIWLLVPGLLWWALKDIQWMAVWSALARLTVWQIASLSALNILVLFFFSIGWWLILQAQGWPIPLWRLTIYRVAAFGISYFTPGPQFGGEPLQVFLLARRHGLPIPVATAATALDRALEVMVNFLFLIIGLALIWQWNLWPGSTQPGALLVLSVIALLMAAFVWGIWRGAAPLTTLLRRLPLRKAGYLRLVAGVAESEGQVSELCRNHPKTLLAVIGMAVVNWILILVEYWLGMYFLGLALTPQQLITAVTINRLAFLAPLPGGLGALEGSQVLAMTLLGLDPALGVSEGLIIRARDVVTGLVGLWIGWAYAQAKEA